MSSKREEMGAVCPPDAETSAIVHPIFFGMMKYRRVPSVTKGENFRSRSLVSGVKLNTFGAGRGNRNQNASATIATVAVTPSGASHRRYSRPGRASDVTATGT